MLKKTASKPLPPNYIAFDDDRGELIAAGTKESVLDSIKSYCESEGMDEDTIKCSRCEDPTPESELMEVHAWWVCGMCYDDL